MARVSASIVEKVLLPTLRPGDIVIMDNLGSHRGRIVRQLIRSAGAKLFFLPKYSPDLKFLSNRSLPSSSISSEKLPPEAVEAVCRAIGEMLQDLHTQKNAQTTSQTQDTDEPNFIAL